VIPSEKFLSARLVGSCSTPHLPVDSVAAWGKRGHQSTLQNRHAEKPPHHLLEFVVPRPLTTFLAVPDVDADGSCTKHNPSAKLAAESFKRHPSLTPDAVPEVDVERARSAY